MQARIRIEKRKTGRASQDVAQPLEVAGATTSSASVVAEAERVLGLIDEVLGG